MAKREPTDAQRAAAKERREKFREIVKKLAAMSESDRAALAASLPAIATCEGRALSIHNQCLIAVQFPSATLVGGFRQWRKQGRSVRKGEHGLMIWVPIAKGESATETSGEFADEKPGFIMGTVFDVSQTCELGASESEAA